MAGHRDDAEGRRRRRGGGGGVLRRGSSASLSARRICVSLLLLLSPSRSFPSRGSGGDELNSSYDDWQRQRRGTDREEEGEGGGGAASRDDDGHRRRQSQQKLQSRRRRLLGPTPPAPAQSYVVPLREDDVAFAFDGVSAQDLSSDAILSQISVATSVDGTVVWYDHWEDGYDEGDPTDPIQRSGTTLVLGDGDPDNGCVEMIRKRSEDPPDWNYVCGAGDVDLIGQYEVLVFVNEAAIATPRNAAEVLFDGGDAILSSFPVTVTRMVHSTTADDLSSSAEAFEAQTYAGKTFRSPFGQDTTMAESSFTLTQLHIMAVEMGPTEITYDGTVVATLSGKGETTVVDDYLEFKKLESDKDVQVTLVTGERGAATDYEIRVFGLLPVSRWGSEYFDPVSSDANGNTAVWIYRLAGSGINSFTHESLVNTIDADLNDGTPTEDGFAGYITSAVAATGTRVHMAADEAFFALSCTDQPSTTMGATYDWGHPLLPVDMLTSRAVVGWGRGCEQNLCGDGNGERSAVFVTPVEDADIYVDYDGDGTYEESHAVVRLGQLILTDDADEDMTGAVLFANNSATGDGVKFAAAWGRSPILSGNMTVDPHGLDMGTSIVPVPHLAVSAILSLYDDHGALGANRTSPGDTLKVTVRFTNTRGSHAGPIPPGTLTVILDDPSLFNHIDYVPNSAQYTDDLGNVADVPDGLLPNTAFPLDEGGVSNQFALNDGTAHAITFLAKVKETPSLTSDVIELRGRLVDSTDGAELPFLAQVRMAVEAELKVEQVAYRGRDGGASCADAFASAEAKAVAGAGDDDLLYVPPDSDVTFCYRVSNTGDAYLDQFVLSDAFGTVWGDNGGPAVVAPGDVANLFVERTLGAIGDRVDNAVRVDGRPRLLNGYLLPEGVQSFDAEYAVTVRAVAYNMNSPLHCESFDHTMTEGYFLTNFEFVAHSTGCVNVRVFANDRPPSPAEESGGTLDDTWTLLCRADVQGMGAAATNVTNIPPDYCSPVYLAEGTTVHFYVSVRAVDQTDCDGGPVLSGTDYGVLVSKETAGTCSA